VIDTDMSNFTKSPSGKFGFMGKRLQQVA
jgi:hypothetical protein